MKYYIDTDLHEYEDLKTRPYNMKMIFENVVQCVHCTVCKEHIQVHVGLSPLKTITP